MRSLTLSIASFFSLQILDFITMHPGMNGSVDWKL